MEIYLVRHTTPDISREVCYGQTDIPLAATFSEEIKAILAHLPTDVDMIYSSPLERCLQLAERIPHKSLESVPQLMEMNFGDWELQPWADIPQEQLDRWMKDFVTHQVPNGESMEMLANRVYTWYGQLRWTSLDKIVIVTHAGPIRVLLSKVHNTPLSEAFNNYPVRYGEVISVGS